MFFLNPQYLSDLLCFVITSFYLKHLMMLNLCLMKQISAWTEVFCLTHIIMIKSFRSHSYGWVQWTTWACLNAIHSQWCLLNWVVFIGKPQNVCISHYEKLQQTHVTSGERLTFKLPTVFIDHSRLTEAFHFLLAVEMMALSWMWNFLHHNSDCNAVFALVLSNSASLRNGPLLDCET